MSRLQTCFVVAPRHKGTDMIKNTAGWAGALVWAPAQSIPNRLDDAEQAAWRQS
jgi:hypothetical protein